MEKKDTSEIVLKRTGSISPQPVCEERRSGMMKVDLNTKNDYSFGTSFDAVLCCKDAK